MRKRSIKLNIPEPCRKNWDEMKPAGNGKHCESCNKCVKDFTGMSDEEVFRTIKNSKGTVCGRFNNSQLDRAIESYEQSSLDLLKIAAIAAGFALFSPQSNAQELSSPAKTEIKTGEKDKSSQQDALEHNEVRGDTLDIITGSVTDEGTGKPISYATIALLNNGVIISSALSDIDGQYTMKLNSHKAGNYSIKIMYIGYYKEEKVIGENISHELILNFKLKSSPRLMTMGIVSEPPIDINNFSDTKTYKFPR